MKKDVKIKIIGIQTIPEMEEPEKIELETTGVFYQKEGMNYLKYDEYFEGASEPAKNLLKFDDTGLEITKKGPVNTVMSFGRNKNSTAHYYTPHGPLFLQILTEAYEMKEQEKGICVDINYCIDYNYDFLTRCSLRIDIALL